MLTRLTGAVAIALLIGSAAGHAQKPQGTALAPGGLLPLLEAYLESLRQQTGIPGMSATIVRDGETIWEKGFGYQDVGGRIGATPDTPYLVGDMSQTLAAMLLLQCVEQRRLDLDAPLSTYGLTDPEPGATLRQLLSHQPPDGGKDFVYNPSRFDRLTALTEWCVPQPYRKSVAHRLLGAAAMMDSVPGTDLRDPAFALPPDLFDQSEIDRYHAVLARMALAYKIDTRGRPSLTDIPLVTMSAAGGLVSTVRDLASLDKALDGGHLLLDDTRQRGVDQCAGAQRQFDPDGARLVRPELPGQSDRLAFRLRAERLLVADPQAT